MNRAERIDYLLGVKDKLSRFKNGVIENGVLSYCLHQRGCTLSDYNISEEPNVEEILLDNGFPTELETIVEFFELLVEDETKGENGIIFTPKYIADYIVDTTMNEISVWSDDISIMDPSCGCGIFLISAAEFLFNRFSVSIDSIIHNNIHGIDIIPENIHRCKLILILLSAYHGGHITYDNLNHIICCDSLKMDWNKHFNSGLFDYIIGNPPYVNPHNMRKETALFLKSTFMTTKSGVFNIFYAFIEHAMKFLAEGGVLGYIVPNNFLTIKSAMELRLFLQKGEYIKRILDFGPNMVFQPTRTYNCILILAKEKHVAVDYCVMDKTEDIRGSIETAEFDTLQTNTLDKNGWKLVDRITHRNIERIENQGIQIKGFIRTGIATLRDNVYLVDCDSTGCFKQTGDKRFSIESGIVKTIYKIPELKQHNNIRDAARHIIFPYLKGPKGFTLIPEDTFKIDFPMAYEYLLHEKKTLADRDNGKGVSQGWYAYGRTQGLNKYGKKLLFPTFSNKPNFIQIDDESSLFCNGYAIFENDLIDLALLSRVLNSSVMDYYVQNTSYPIEGGYYCYQKKYIERFSLPTFTPEEKAILWNASDNDVNNFLINRYGLTM